MIRIHLTAADLARVRFAPRPAPLLELNTALLTLGHPGGALRYGPWRERLLHRLPRAAEPLLDLVPAGVAPSFLDVFSDDLGAGLDAPRATPAPLVRAELARVYAAAPGPPPPWVRDLHRGDATGWQVLHRAQRAAFDTVIGPVWSLVQEMHQAEFARHALTAAEAGVGAALTAAVPGSVLHADGWELPAPHHLELRPAGRGLALLPTFHWPGHPLVADPPDPDQPLYVTYPAGPGIPLTPTAAGGSDTALAAVLGRTRHRALLLLADAHTTGDLARRLGVSAATASAHAAALRGAGLISTARTGRAVLHRRTPLGTLLAARHQGAAPAAPVPVARPRPPTDGTPPPGRTAR
ncbi:ArsR family transcriptional regulator [Streptomyces sp. HSW2009]|uniref:ArsR family transcriptional regulator n=1 Tax=Streptomyces sp. HSW2009 TaxID=3142890 RepID=UPI0032EFEEC6